MRSLRNNARKGMSPSQRDTFIEGQISVRSPKARNQINMLKMSQVMQAERLAMPRQRSVERLADMVERESKNFLRSSQNFASFDNAGNGMNKTRQSSTLQRKGLNHMMGSTSHVRSHSNSALNDF